MFLRFLSLAKEKQFYYKLMATLLIISILPVLIISIFSYSYAKSTLENELNGASITNLKQTVNAMEIVFRQINDSCRQLSVDTAFRDFLNFPSGYYYEGLKGELSRSELPIISKYLENKDKVFQRLNALKFSNEYIDSVYLYDRKKDILLTDGGIQYSFPDFYDKEWQDAFINTRTIPVFMDIRELRPQDRNGKNVLTVIYKAPYNTFSNEEYGLVVNLSVDYIYNNIIRKIDNRPENIFYVTSQSGREIFGRAAVVHRQKELRENAPDSVSEASVGELENGKVKKQVLYTAVTSEMLQWKFVVLRDLESMHKGIRFIRWTIVFVSILLLLLIVLFAFISSRSIYNPILSILQYIKGNSPENEKSAGGRAFAGELRVIANTLRNALEERENLQQRLMESIPAYKEKFINALLRGKQYNMEEIRERMGFLGMDMPLQDLVVLVLAVNGENLSRSDIEDKIYKELNVRDFMERLLMEKYKGTAVESEEERLVLIVSCGKDDIGSLFIFAQVLKEELKKLFEINFAVGIGGHCGSIRDIDESFREAKEAVRYGMMSNCDEVVYIEDIRVNKGQVLSYPAEKESTLCSFIKNGDGENAQRAFLEFLRELALQDRKIYYQLVQQVFIQLLSSLVNIIHTMGLDAGRIFKEGNDYYSALLGKSEMDAVQWLKQVIEKITREISAAMSEKNNRHIKDIIRLLDKDCGMNISLNSVAGELNLNPAYLSRIFKENTGKTFLEYLTSVRLEKSKKLLKETNLMIKEIGERVGYNNSHYFIKLFKEQVGTTPGEYRNLKG